jgi:hypothetical protein
MPMSRIDRAYLHRLAEENQARLEQQAHARLAMENDERQPLIQAMVDEILATLPQKLEAAARGGHHFAVIYDRYRDPFFHEIFAQVSTFCAKERLTVRTAHRDTPAPHGSQSDLIIVSW